MGCKQGVLKIKTNKSSCLDGLDAEFYNKKGDIDHDIHWIQKSLNTTDLKYKKSLIGKTLNKNRTKYERHWIWNVQYIEQERLCWLRLRRKSSYEQTRSVSIACCWRETQTCNQTETSTNIKDNRANRVDRENV